MKFVPSACILAASIAAASRVCAQTIYGGAQTLDGLQHQANTRNDARLQQRRDAEWRRAFRAQDLTSNERRGMAAQPSKSPALYITGDPRADALDTLADSFHDRYFKGRPTARVRRYVRDRYAAYVRSVTTDGMRANNLASACDYDVERLYALGERLDAAGERATIRGTCVMFFQQAESRGFAPTNAAKTSYLQYLAVYGGLLEDLDAHPAAGVAITTASLRTDARDLFKSLFHVPIETIPPAKFACIFATPATDCELIMRVYPKFIGSVAARYP